jgi:hypothetical protein
LKNLRIDLGERVRGKKLKTPILVTGAAGRVGRDGPPRGAEVVIGDLLDVITV